MKEDTYSVRIRGPEVSDDHFSSHLTYSEGIPLRDTTSISMDFNAYTQDYVNISLTSPCPSSPGECQDGFTFLLWLRTGSEVITNQMQVFATPAAESQEGGVALYLEYNSANEEWKAVVNINEPLYSWECAASGIRKQQWTYIAFMWDGTDLNLYLNETLKCSTEGLSSAVTAGSNGYNTSISDSLYSLLLGIGMSPDGTANYFHGQMQNFTFYTVPKQEEFVLDRFNQDISYGKYTSIYFQLQKKRKKRKKESKQEKNTNNALA